MAPSSASLAWVAGVLVEARAGRREALGRLVVEFSPLLWQVARTAGLDRGASEDVVQTTWLRLLDHLDGILHPAALIGWLVTVARRGAGRGRRARPRGGPRRAGPPPAPPPPPGPPQR